MTTTTAPKSSTGEQALNLAMDAGFVITKHGRTCDGNYWHQLNHRDGRSLTIHTRMDGRFVQAQGYNRGLWMVSRLAAYTMPRLRRLLVDGAPAIITDWKLVPAEVHALRQGVAGEYVWQRVGPDEWLAVCSRRPDRPCEHAADTEEVLQFGPVKPVPNAKDLATVERLTAHLIGHTVDLDLLGLGTLRLNVASNRGGFLVGVAEPGFPYVTHLVDAPEVLRINR